MTSAVIFQRLTLAALVALAWGLLSSCGEEAPVRLGGDVHDPVLHTDVGAPGTAGENPQVSADRRAYSKGPAPGQPTADVRFNIIWGYDYAMIVRGHDPLQATANIVSNLFSAAPGGVHRSNHIIPVGNQQIHAAGNVTLEDCRTEHQWLSNIAITATNGVSNAAPFAAPAVPGPGATEYSAVLGEWAAVLAGAGPSVHPDDPVDVAARAAIQLPAEDIFLTEWNDG